MLLVNENIKKCDYSRRGNGMRDERGTKLTLGA